MLDSVSLVAFPSFTAPPLEVHPRRLWGDLERAGLMGAGAALGGAEGHALSALQVLQLVTVVTDLESAGVHFAHATPEQVVRRCADPRAGELRVGGADMGTSRFPARSLGDLRLLDTLYLTHDFQTLGNPALAGALHHMGALGLRLFESRGGGTEWTFKYEYRNEPDTVKDLGKYGAYQAFADGTHIANRPLVVDFSGGEGSPSRIGQAMHDADEIVGVAWYNFKSPNAEHDGNPLAVALRDLGDAGYTFSKIGSDRLRVKNLLQLDPQAEVDLGVGGYRLQKVRLADLMQATAISPLTKHLQRLYSKTLKPWSEQFAIDGDDVGEVIRACCKSGPGLDLEDRWMLLCGLAGLQRVDHHTAAAFGRLNLRPAVQDFDFLLTLPEAGSDVWRKTDVPLYQELLQSLPGPRARAIFPLLRARLDRPRPGEDFAQTKDDHIALASLEGAEFLLDMPDAGSDAWWKRYVPLYEGLAASLPPDRARAACTRLVRLTADASDDEEQRLGQDACVALMAGDTVRVRSALRGMAPSSRLRASLETLQLLHDQRIALGIPAGSDRSASEGALVDYDVVETHRLDGESLASAARRLQIIHQSLAGREGWVASRDTFAYLQDGLRHHRFCGRNAEVAVGDLLYAYLTGSRIEEARASLLTPRTATSAKTIVEGQDEVTIGGIRIPRRPTGFACQ